MRDRLRRGDATDSPVLSPCGLPGVHVQLLVEEEFRQEPMMSDRRRPGTVTLRGVAVSIHHVSHFWL